MTEKNLQYYQRLPYTRVVELRSDEPGQAYFVARIREIPFIEMEGETREDALANLQETFDDCVLALIETGAEIPEPDLWPGVIQEQRLPPLPTRRIPAETRGDATVANLGVPKRNAWDIVSDRNKLVAAFG